VCNVDCRVLCVDSVVLRAMALRLLGKMKNFSSARKVTIPLNCL